MKLNLLPTYVSSEGRSVVGVVVGVVLLAVGVGAAFLMMTSAQAAVDDAVANANRYGADHQAALKNVRDSETVIAEATDFDTNIKLSEAMLAHSTIYPDLYDTVIQHIPGNLRLTALTAQPAGPGSVVINLTGTVASFQEYADITLNLYKIPGAVSVARSGFVSDNQVRPGLNTTDQLGTPVDQGEGNLPSDPIDRMNEIIRRAGDEPTGYLNTGGFGTEAETKGAMPGSSLVTFTVTMATLLDMSAPDPRATLGGGGGGTQAGGFGGGFGAPAGAGGPPAGFGGPPPGVGGPPPGVGGPPAGVGGPR